MFFFFWTLRISARVANILLDNVQLLLNVRRKLSRSLCPKKKQSLDIQIVLTCALFGVWLIEKFIKCLHCSRLFFVIIQHEECIIVTCSWTIHIFFALNDTASVVFSGVFCGIQMAQTSFGVFDWKIARTNCNAIHWKHTRSCYRIRWYWNIKKKNTLKHLHYLIIHRDRNGDWLA